MGLADIVEKLENYEFPSATTSATLVLVSYFVITAGIAYDIINEPPAIGGVRDPVSGAIKPQTFMPHRNNGQYIMEGLLGSFMYMMGAVGLLFVNASLNRQLEGKFRQISLGLGSAMVIIAYLSVRGFFTIKMPSYLYYNDW